MDIQSLLNSSDSPSHTGGTYVTHSPRHPAQAHPSYEYGQPPNSHYQLPPLYSQAASSYESPRHADQRRPAFPPPHHEPHPLSNNDYHYTYDHHHLPAIQTPAAAQYQPYAVQQQQHQYSPRQMLPPPTAPPAAPQYDSFQQTERVSARLKIQAEEGTRPPPTYVHQHIEDEYDDEYPPTPLPPPYRNRKRSGSVTDHGPRAKKAKKASNSGAAPTPAPKKSAAKRENTKLSRTNSSDGDSLTTTEIYGQNPDPAQIRSHKDCKFSLQTARCMSTKYKAYDLPKCVACTRRWAGDTCRFQKIRIFVKDAATGAVVGVTFRHVGQGGDSENMRYPTKWNVPLQEHHIRTVRMTAAKNLLPMLREELDHASLTDCLLREREKDVRATCDCCMTSLFGSGWMCKSCGREACTDCFEQIRVQANGDSLEEGSCPHGFFVCVRKRQAERVGPPHVLSDFAPISRFQAQNLKSAIQEMEDLLATQQPEEDTAGRLPIIDSPAAFIPKSHLSLLTPTRDILRIEHTHLTEELFSQIWRIGDPLVVTGLIHRFSLEWSPAFFSEKYGPQSCVVLDIESEANNPMTVSQFFEGFGKYEGRQAGWKLKDWPPSADFKDSFPDLYKDFSKAVPVPNYVTRDGVLNMASHFATNTVVPDLGPKMYNAMEASRLPGTKGSTKLHMDMADAVNIMTHAEPMADGSEGCAAWDLFLASDSNLIRDFLNTKFRTNAIFNDPIHSQNFYLDETLRAELFEIKGVMSFRVYQRPGDAVFIPAGCAHQVANLSDCVKVAVDFISPENVGRCEELTKQFRAENQSKQWKEDVLQLRTTLWFAWASCTAQLKSMREAEADASNLR